jgi:hypothetical protein
VCGTFQDTKSLDELTYNVGRRPALGPGVAISCGSAMKGIGSSYRQGDQPPGIDQLKLGIIGRY